MEIPEHFLTGLELGLVQPAQVICWADGQIAAMDDPPEWMIELAMVRPDVQECADLLRAHGAATRVDDDDAFLGLISVGFFRSGWDVFRTSQLLFDRFSHVERTGPTPMQLRVYELDHFTEFSPLLAVASCRQLLKPYLSSGERLISRSDAD